MKAMSFLKSLLGIFSGGRAGGPRRPGDPPAALVEGLEREEVPEWSLVTKYSVGPVSYMVYRSGDGVLRLLVREPPEPDVRTLVELAAGQRRPSNDVEEYYMNKERSGYGPLYPLILDPHIEEISYTGMEQHVAVIHKIAPSRWMLTNIALTREQADGIAVELARKAGKSVNVASPYVEGLTQEGHRVSVSFMSEITRFGSTFVIRKFPQKPVTIGDLLASGALTPLMAAYLWLIMEAQGFIIISGPMGSGKTTLLQGLLTLLPPYVKVITIEDTPELVVKGPLWDPFITRPRLPGQEVDEVTLEDLLKFALRRRADYVVVGEVRGREARLLAQAAASGYGALTTMHADSPAGVVMRLTSEPINLPPSFLASVSAVVQLARLPGVGGSSSRRVSEIAEVGPEGPTTVLRWGEKLGVDDVVERSSRVHWAAERLGIGDVKDDLEERVAVLEDLAGKGLEEIRARLVRYYTSKYGDVI